MKKNSNKAWGGRFRMPLSKNAEKFTASIDFDKRLYKADILQSIAYAKALKKAKVLNEKELKKITNGLEGIMRGIESGRIKYSIEFEDIHMNIEKLLIDQIGDAGKKLHTGRSRNDQVSTDLRMYLKGEITEVIALIKRLQQVVLDLAEENISIMIPGYTHLQRAQPVLLSHQLMAYYEMLERDKARLRQAYERCDVMPLGSGALAGVNFNLDRIFLAKELGFSQITQNSMDAVSDRDFVIDCLSASAQIIMHLSRFSEEIILWSTFEFDYIELSDAYTTGSSLMPQKKNPDIAELVRGKSGRIYGNLFSVLTMMKALPLAYNRDMQEDKEPLFDSIDTIKEVLQIFAEMIKSAKFNKEIADKAVRKGHLTATDIVYYLVRQGVPFRDAHENVGKIVAHCVESNMELEYLSLKQLKEFSDKFSYDVQRIISAEASIASKETVGGTSSKKVREAIKSARTNLLRDKA